MLANVRSLAAIRKQKARISVAKPAELNGVPGERSNISEQGLDSGEGEEHTTKAAPSLVLVAYQIFECVVWIEGFEDRVIVPTPSATIMKRM